MILNKELNSFSITGDLGVKGILIDIPTESD